MRSNKPAATKSYLPFIIIGAVLVAAIAAVAWVYRAGNESGAAQETASGGGNFGGASGLPAAKREALPGAQPPHSKGVENAPVVIEEFGDYQCPPCGALHPTMQKIEDDYGDRVRVIFRNLPLQQIHKNAFSAARAAEASALQGKFWQMHDMIYKNQKEWSNSPEPRPIFASYAGRLGMDVEKFKADMDKTEVSSRIVADLRRANGLNVGGTPTLFLNGKELPAQTALEPAKLRAAIDGALAEKGK